MSKAHKQRQKNWQERNGILGELNLSPFEVLLLEKILDRMCYHYNRTNIQLSYIFDLNNTATIINDQVIDDTHKKFQRLANHLRYVEHARACTCIAGAVCVTCPTHRPSDIKPVLVPEEADYCG